MFLSHATLQAGNLVSLIHYSEWERPAPLEILEIAGDEVLLKGVRVPFPRARIYFLKITAPTLLAVGFTEEYTMGGRNNSREFSRLLHYKANVTRLTVRISEGLHPNATMLEEGQVMASALNWLHEIQNVYHSRYGEMIFR